MPGRSRIDKFKRTTARRLRANTTNAEDILWPLLRALKLRGTHFRRQQPIGKYIADFACLASRLVIEVDGSQHAESEARRKDQARTAWLESEGYRVLRLWNNDIMQNIEGVMEAIYAALYGSLESESRVIKHSRCKPRE